MIAKKLKPAVGEGEPPELANAVVKTKKLPNPQSDELDLKPVVPILDRAKVMKGAAKLRNGIQPLVK